MILEGQQSLKMGKTQTVANHLWGAIRNKIIFFMLSVGGIKTIHTFVVYYLNSTVNKV